MKGTRNADMRRWRAVLFSNTGIWGDGVQSLLQQEEDFLLVSALPLECENLASIVDLRPDVIFVAEGADKEHMQAFLARLIDTVPEVPVILLSLSQPRVQVIHIHALPSRWETVLESVLRDLEKKGGLETDPTGSEEGSTSTPVSYPEDKSTLQKGGLYEET